MWHVHKHPDHPTDWVCSTHPTDPGYLDGFSYPTEAIARRECRRLILLDLQLMLLERRVWSAIMVVGGVKGRPKKCKKVTTG
jgi:hypothetical protein